MRFWMALLLTGLLPAAAWAETAAEVADLQGKVAAAEAHLEAVKRRIAAARGRNRAADAELQASVRQLMRVRQYPAGFWVMRSVLTDSPMQAELMGVISRQQGQRLVTAQAEAKQLTALYGEINRQLQAVRDVQAAYAGANGRLMEAEKVVLRRAGVQAEALGADLQEALAGSVTLVDVVRPAATKVRDSKGVAGGLPVAGRVERAFGAVGTSRSGVVLKAAGEADVRATQAARVLYAGPFRHFGGLVIMKTVRGADVLLGGLGQLAVRAGEDVAAGEVIGRAAAEGRIYWEVRRGGRVVNPLGGDSS